MNRVQTTCLEGTRNNGPHLKPTAAALAPTSAMGRALVASRLRCTSRALVTLTGAVDQHTTNQTDHGPQAV